MEEEVSQEEKEIVGEKTLDQIIKEADVYIDGKKVEEKETEEKQEAQEKQEDKTETETESQEKEEKTESQEEKSASEKEEKKPPEKEELTPEKFEELSGKFPELKTHKDSHENYNNWEKSLRQKAQFISWYSKLSPEQQEAVINKNLPLVYGNEELPKAPKDLVDEVMKNVVVEDITVKDEDDLEYKVDKDKIRPQILRAVEHVLNNVAPEMGATRKQLFEMGEKNKELEEGAKALQGRLGELEFENLIVKHPFLDVKRVDKNESIMDAVNRIAGTGDSHPEYNKLLKLQAIGGLADRKGWTPEMAFQNLYGEEERKEKDEQRAKEVTEKNQQEATQEKPGGEKPPVKEDWEEAMGDTGKTEKIIDKYFEDAGV